MNKDGSVKLGDLNVSKIAKFGLMRTQTGTPYYASPEVWLNKPYSSKCDIWSLGCVIYELTALRPPFMAQDMKGLYNKILKGVYPAIPNHYSKELSQMIKFMLSLDPSVRPSTEDIMKMGSFKSHLKPQLSPLYP